MGGFPAKNSVFLEEVFSDNEKIYRQAKNSLPAVAITIVSTHFAYTWRDGQAELACIAWSNIKIVYLQKVIHLCTNPAQRRLTSMTDVEKNDQLSQRTYIITRD